MRHLRLLVLVALAVLITAQPVLHHHSLDSEGTSPCSVCAFGAYAAVHAPAIGEPVASALTFAAITDRGTPADVARATSARAPPRG